MYKDIASNKRRTWILLTVVCIVITLLFLAIGAMADADPLACVILGALFAIIYSLISFYLADKTILITQGAKKLSKENAKEIYLLVENLTIASGMPLPEIYLIDDPSPNAFATGRDPEHAKIVFTTGLLQKLDKLELEGVIAHELSHIKNYDIRLMTLVVVLVGLIALLADIIFRVGLLSGKASRRTPWPLILIAIIIGALSPIFAQLIRLAVSRTREYLADASACLLTRHPDGLASALEKIRDSQSKMTRANHATACLFIANPFGETRGRTYSFFQKLFATHPPIDERIARLRTMGQ
ncbi:M48 family metallopeptidase [Patescibacteria group bacterium]|nr:M48 family metallopeptidase [Patescibacteria group bacterium]MCG2687472.1 M48 family metallopeptidase [Candidatus Parcubacteria bacterium]